MLFSMSTANIGLTVEAAPNNHGIIAAYNYGDQHNHYHNYDTGKTNIDSSIQLRDRFFLSDPVIDRQVLHEAKGTRVPGTFDWIHGNDAYCTWLSGSSSVLWITGSPGKGKAMMAMYLATQLERSVASGTLTNDHDLSVPRRPVPRSHSSSIQPENASKDTIQRVYAFFCRSDDEKRNSAVAVLRGLIYQILSSEPNLASLLNTEMEAENKSTSTLASREAL